MPRFSYHKLIFSLLALIVAIQPTPEMVGAFASTLGFNPQTTAQMAQVMAIGQQWWGVPNAAQAAPLTPGVLTPW